MTVSLCRHCCWADRWLVLRDQLLYTDRTLRLACALPLRSRPVPAVGVPYGLQYRPCASPLPAPLAFRLRLLPPSFSLFFPDLFSSFLLSRHLVFSPHNPPKHNAFLSIPLRLLSSLFILFSVRSFSSSLPTCTSSYSSLSCFTTCITPHPALPDGAPPITLFQSTPSPCRHTSTHTTSNSSTSSNMLPLLPTWLLPPTTTMAAAPEEAPGWPRRTPRGSSGA